MGFAGTTIEQLLPRRRKVSARAIAPASGKARIAGAVEPIEADGVISACLRTIHQTEMNTLLRRCSSEHYG
jgi:hypothetical protein